MKKYFLLLVSLFVASAVLLAEESVIIDFNDLAGNADATMIDLEAIAGDLYTDEEIANISASLAIEDWSVRLNSSARTVMNQAVSFIRQAPVARGNYAGETVLGARVRFPTHDYNAWALISPPFEIPAYAGQGGAQFDNRGVLKNVGTVRSVSVNAYGLEYPHRLSVIFTDHENREREYVLGDLEYQGWRTLTWNNPAYIEDVRNRDLSVFPLYPQLPPSLRFMGFRIYRDGTREGGDFVTYLRDVTVVYDLAVLDLELDIDDEAIWGILDERSRTRNAAQFRRFAEDLRLQYYEELRRDTTGDNVDTAP